MPIYEYLCKYCNEKFELLRSFSDKDDEIKCPRCGKSNVKRAISTFSTASSADSCAPGSSSGSG